MGLGYRVRLYDAHQRLNIHEVARLFGVVPATIRKRVWRGKFPKPVKPDGALGRSMWVAREVYDLLRQQEDERGTK